ncbi:MAG: hypothetical protein EKK55_17390 [Rhodocyclaceae bacterium]|nr:MAG: hypothetical protein EKK55_17390 [Rhodocyclaceae bacterium]
MNSANDLEQSEGAPRGLEEDGEHRIEREIRCRMCDKFLTRIVIVVLTPGEVKVSDVGVNLKFGTETKCNRCKTISYDLVAI